MDYVNQLGQQLMMVRRAAPTPQVSMPEGWSVRSMREGEGAVWARICLAAGFFDDGMSAEQRWDSAMGNDAGVRTENVFFACDPAGEPVATATARLIPQQDRGKYPPTSNALGYLHYVAATPACRGKGAGSAVTAAVLARFAELNLDDCVLSTDDHRLPAIHIYLKMGWIPVLFAPDMRERWEHILSQLTAWDALEAMDETGRAVESLRRK